MVKDKLKLFLFLTNEALHHDVGSACMDPCLLDLSTICTWVVSLMPRPLLPRRKSSLVPLITRLGGSKNRSDWHGEVKIFKLTGIFLVQNTKQCTSKLRNVTTELHQHERKVSGFTKKKFAFLSKRVSFQVLLYCSQWRIFICTYPYNFSPNKIIHKTNTACSHLKLDKRSYFSAGFLMTGDVTLWFY